MSKVMQEPRRDPEAQQSDADADTKAFPRIVHEHYAAVLSQAQRILHDPAEAEDCTQEAFAEACTQLHTLQDPRALPGWLRGIVRHRCLRRLRRRDFFLVSLGEDVETFPGPAEAATDDLRERLARVRGLIDELPR